MSPPDVSANHRVASNAHHEGTSPWCIRDGTTFSDWKASGSLLWIHGIRKYVVTPQVLIVADTSSFIAGSGKSVLRYVSP